MKPLLICLILACGLAGCETMPSLAGWVRSQNYVYHTGYSDEDILGWEVSFDELKNENGKLYRTNFSPQPNATFAYTHDDSGFAEQSFSSKKTLQLGGSSAVNFISSGVPTDIGLNTSKINSIQFDIKEGKVRRMLQIFPKKMIRHGERITKYVVSRELRAGTLNIEQFDKNDTRLTTGFDLAHDQELGTVRLSYSDNTKSLITGADILIGYRYEKIELIGKQRPKRYALAPFEYLYAGDAYVRVDGIRENGKGGYEAAIVVVNNGYDFENTDNSNSTVFKSTRTGKPTQPVQTAPVFENIRKADDLTPTYITDAEHVAVSSGTRLGTPGSNGDTVTFMIIEDVSPSGISFLAADIEVVRK